MYRMKSIFHPIRFYETCQGAHTKRPMRYTYHRVVDDGMAPVRRGDIRAARPERTARQPDLVQSRTDVVLGRWRGEICAADLGHVRDLSAVALFCGHTTSREARGRTTK